eukprot:scaffold11.g4034.t1
MADAGASAASGKRPAFLAGLDDAAPERFYMPRRGTSFSALADAEVVVAGGQSLPVHSHCLATASPVLCEAFAGQAEGRPVAGSKRKRDLATPFSDFSLQDVSLVGCIKAADACRLEENSKAAVDELVRCMQAGEPLSSADALAVTSQLGKEPLAALLASMSAAIAMRPDFSWRVQQFSGLRGEVRSRTFWVADTKWQLEMCPASHGIGKDTHLSLFLRCLTSAVMPLKAKYTLTVHGAEESRDVTVTDIHTFIAGPDGNWGWPELVSLERLRDPARGHLQGDVLRLSARVKVL